MAVVVRKDVINKCVEVATSRAFLFRFLLLLFVCLFVCLYVCFVHRRGHQAALCSAVNRCDRGVQTAGLSQTVSSGRMNFSRAFIKLYVSDLWQARGACGRMDELSI